MSKSGDWDFDAPKLWDLTEKVDARRLTDSWFSKHTISPPSFERQIHALQPVLLANKTGLNYIYKKKKLLNRTKGNHTGLERMQNKLHKNENIKPDQNNTYPIEEEKRQYSNPFHVRHSRTYTDSEYLSLLQLKPSSISSLLISNHNPITVEMGRNNTYDEEERLADMHYTKHAAVLSQAEENEVKRKYVYMNYDRMHETVKKAKMVLQESRQKSEQWHSMKRKIA